MTTPAKVVAPSGALYIKLGRSGSWEKECLERGILRFGYKETPLDAAQRGDWKVVWQAWFEMRGDAGTATRDLGQIRNFFEAGDKMLWITLSSGMLWWCFAKPGVRVHEDKKGTYRRCLDGWCNTDINGKKLSSERLSGNLLQVQGFRGTICDVKAFDYLVRKLNGQYPQQIEVATKAENEMVKCIASLLSLLTWQDFELLVDLVFSKSGWQRVGQIGKTQKTVDIELVQPITGQRAFVQVKSSATNQDFAKYLERFKESNLYDWMFFVWHTGNVSGPPEQKGDVALIGPERLSRMVFNAGLTSWLREKVS
jgi:hypothetical protein